MSCHHSTEEVREGHARTVGYIAPGSDAICGRHASVCSNESEREQRTPGLGERRPRDIRKTIPDTDATCAFHAPLDAEKKVHGDDVADHRIDQRSNDTDAETARRLNNASDARNAAQYSGILGLEQEKRPSVGSNTQKVRRHSNAGGIGDKAQRGCMASCHMARCPSNASEVQKARWFKNANDATGIAQSKGSADAPGRRRPSNASDVKKAHRLSNASDVAGKAQSSTAPQVQMARRPSNAGKAQKARQLNDASDVRGSLPIRGSAGVQEGRRPSNASDAQKVRRFSNASDITGISSIRVEPGVLGTCRPSNASNKQRARRFSNPSDVSGISQSAAPPQLQTARLASNLGGAQKGRQQMGASDATRPPPNNSAAAALGERRPSIGSDLQGGRQLSNASDVGEVARSSREANLQKAPCPRSAIGVQSLRQPSNAGCLGKASPSSGVAHSQTARRPSNAGDVQKVRRPSNAGEVSGLSHRTLAPDVPGGRRPSNASGVREVRRPSNRSDITGVSPGRVTPSALAGRRPISESNIQKARRPSGASGIGGGSPRNQAAGAQNARRPSNAGNLQMVRRLSGASDVGGSAPFSKSRHPSNSSDAGKITQISGGPMAHKTLLNNTNGEENAAQGEGVVNTNRIRRPSNASDAKKTMVSGSPLDAQKAGRLREGSTEEKMAQNSGTPALQKVRQPSNAGRAENTARSGTSEMRKGRRPSSASDLQASVEPGALGAQGVRRPSNAGDMQKIAGGGASEPQKARRHSNAGYVENIARRGASEIHKGRRHSVASVMHKSVGGGTHEAPKARRPSNAGDMPKVAQGGAPEVQKERRLSNASECLRARRGSDASSATLKRIADRGKGDGAKPAASEKPVGADRYERQERRVERTGDDASVKVGGSFGAHGGRSARESHDPPEEQESVRPTARGGDDVGRTSTDAKFKAYRPHCGVRVPKMSETEDAYCKDRRYDHEESGKGVSSKEESKRASARSSYGNQGGGFTLRGFCSPPRNPPRCAKFVIGLHPSHRKADSEIEPITAFESMEIDAQSLRATMELHSTPDDCIMVLRDIDRCLTSTMFSVNLNRATVKMGGKWIVICECGTVYDDSMENQSCNKSNNQEVVGGGKDACPQVGAASTDARNGDKSTSSRVPAVPKSPTKPEAPDTGCSNKFRRSSFRHLILNPTGNISERNCDTNEKDDPAVTATIKSTSADYRAPVDQPDPTEKLSMSAAPTCPDPRPPSKQAVFAEDMPSATDPQALADQPVLAEDLSTSSRPSATNPQAPADQPVLANDLSTTVSRAPLDHPASTKDLSISPAPTSPNPRTTANQAVCAADLVTPAAPTSSDHQPPADRALLPEDVPMSAAPNSLDPQSPSDEALPAKDLPIPAAPTTPDPRSPANQPVLAKDPITPAAPVFPSLRVPADQPDLGKDLLISSAPSSLNPENQADPLVLGVNVSTHAATTSPDPLTPTDEPLPAADLATPVAPVFPHHHVRADSSLPIATHHPSSPSSQATHKKDCASQHTAHPPCTSDASPTATKTTGGGGNPVNRAYLTEETTVNVGAGAPSGQGTACDPDSVRQLTSCGHVHFRQTRLWVLTSERSEDLMYALTFSGVIRAESYREYACYDPLDVGSRGASASVTRVVHAKTGNDYALKLMDLKMIDGRTETAHQLALREARLIRVCFGRPNIIQMRDIIVLPNNQWGLVLEYCGLGTLHQLCQKKGTIPFQGALAMTRGILHALSYLLTVSLIHRDVKMDNVLLVTDRKCSDRANADLVQAKLCDFGLAAFEWENAQMKRRCGTPGYVAPEIVCGHPYDCRADVFSTAVCLYRMVCGELPFTGDTVRDILKNTLMGAFTPPASRAALSLHYAWRVVTLLGQPKKRNRPNALEAYRYIGDVICEGAAKKRANSTARTPRGHHMEPRLDTIDMATVLAHRSAQSPARCRANASSTVGPTTIEMPQARLSIPTQIMALNDGWASPSSTVGSPTEASESVTQRRTWQLSSLLSPEGKAVSSRKLQHIRSFSSYSVPLSRNKSAVASRKGLRSSASTESYSAQKPSKKPWRGSIRNGLTSVTEKFSRGVRGMLGINRIWSKKSSKEAGGKEEMPTLLPVIAS